MADVLTRTTCQGGFQPHRIVVRYDTGGESTTMALVAQRWGLIPELQSYAGSNRPIWGTCAGLIFLAERATNQKQGGQALLGGLDVQVARNFFGSQINSFETWLPAPKCLAEVQGCASSGAPAPNTDVFRALFIRAPAITEAGPEVEVLAAYTLSPAELAENPDHPLSVIVAVRSGALLATSFHPELVDDLRWHALFVKMVQEDLKNSPPSKALVKSDIACASRKPRDLPKH